MSWNLTKSSGSGGWGGLARAPSTFKSSTTLRIDARSCEVWQGKIWIRRGGEYGGDIEFCEHRKGY